MINFIKTLLKILVCTNVVIYITALIYPIKAVYVVQMMAVYSYIVISDTFNYVILAAIQLRSLVW